MNEVPEEECCGRCNGINDICITDRPDKDYFQSVREEYGTDQPDEEEIDGVKKGDRFYCYKDCKEFYTRGGYYTSDQDMCITDNDGDTCHGWSGRWKDHFARIETTTESTSGYSGTEGLIVKECEDLKNLLISKNRRYGDSALSRGNIFNMSPVVSIKARIEDKLNRLKHLKQDDQEDVWLDLLGYIILLRIAQKQERI